MLPERALETELKCLSSLRECERKTERHKYLIFDRVDEADNNKTLSCYCLQGHNLVYLHVNYNTFRLAFWALAHLMNDNEALAAVTSEIDDVIGSRDDSDDAIRLSVEDVESLQVLGK